MFGTQALRLLREMWHSPTELAQELYAIFQDSNPTSSGPITITNNTPAGPGMTMNQDNSTGPAIQITKGKTTLGIGMDGNGNLTTSTNGKPAVGAGGGGVPGQVQSGGPGAGPYVVKIYPNGLLGATLNVAATQLQIDSGATIKAGTWTLVTQAGGAYYMQVPVWGSP
jgi:hypothetical protein